MADSIPRSRWLRGARDVLVFGAAAGLLVLVLKLTEYRFLVLEHSVEIYVGVIAALAAAVGIWLGRSLKTAQGVGAAAGRHPRHHSLPTPPGSPSSA